jgi:hypothetical protein
MRSGRRTQGIDLFAQRAAMVEVLLDLPSAVAFDGSAELRVEHLRGTSEVAITSITFTLRTVPVKDARLCHVPAESRPGGTVAHSDRRSAAGRRSAACFRSAARPRSAPCRLPAQRPISAPAIRSRYLSVADCSGDRLSRRPCTNIRTSLPRLISGSPGRCGRAAGPRVALVPPVRPGPPVRRVPPVRRAPPIRPGPSVRRVPAARHSDQYQSRQYILDV